MESLLGAAGMRDHHLEEAAPSALCNGVTPQVVTSPQSAPYSYSFLFSALPQAELDKYSQVKVGIPLYLISKANERQKIYFLLFNPIQLRIPQSSLQHTHTHTHTHARTHAHAGVEKAAAHTHTHTRRCGESSRRKTGKASPEVRSKLGTAPSLGQL